MGSTMFERKSDAISNPFADLKQTTKTPIEEQLVALAEIVRLENPDAIRAFAEKCGIDCRHVTNDGIMAIGHHLRLCMTPTTPAQKLESRDWLIARGLPLPNNVKI